MAGLWRFISFGYFIQRRIPNSIIHSSPSLPQTNRDRMREEPEEARKVVQEKVTDESVLVMTRLPV